MKFLQGLFIKKSTLTFNEVSLGTLSVHSVIITESFSV